jgi:Alkylmercury lyase
MASLVILTADELIAIDVEGRGRARRTARETPTAARVLQMFLDRGGPIPVGEIVAGLRRDSAVAVHKTLVKLDDEDLIRISDGHVDLAYPFSASPTPFVVRFPDGRERHVCCAIDALGIAPMVDQPVEIRARCHHSGTPLKFAAKPEGPGPGAAGLMLWVGKRTEERCRGIDAL